MKYFKASNVLLPEKARAKNYIPSALAFLNTLDVAGFEEAERLQDLDVAVLRENIVSLVRLGDILNVKMVCASSYRCSKTSNKYKSWVQENPGPRICTCLRFNLKQVQILGPGKSWTQDLYLFEV